MKDLRAHLTRNLGTKLLSVALAFTLWLVLVAEQDLTVSWAAPVQYRNSPKDLEVSSDVPEKVLLDLRGPAGRIAPDQLGQAAVVLDLSGVNRPGVRTFPVTPPNLTLPQGVTLDRAVPSQVRLTVERRLSKEIRVQTGEAEAPEGYEATALGVEPSVVTIVGPESVVSRIDSVDTDPVSLPPGAAGSVSVRTQVHLSDGRARVEGGGTVTARFEVKRK